MGTSLNETASDEFKTADQSIEVFSVVIICYLRVLGDGFGILTV
jgi:hypothetical protein